MMNFTFLKNLVSNIMSTVLGIALTIGIAGLVDHQKDKRQAREMMFNIVKSAEDKVSELEQLDSIRVEEIKGVSALLAMNETSFGLESMPDSTLKEYFSKCYKCSSLRNYSGRLEGYFYSSQMMHQFNNAEIYSYFAAYVEYDNATNEDEDALYNEALKIKQTYQSRMMQKKTTACEVIKEMIADRTLTDYCAFLLNVHLKTRISGYNQFFDNLLLEMKATPEEYERYKQQNSLVEEEKVLKLK